MKNILGRVSLAALFSLPLGGCLEVVTHPLNSEPTAYQDSLCDRAPPTAGETVNYGCVAGQEIAPIRHPPS